MHLDATGAPMQIYTYRYMQLQNDENFRLCLSQYSLFGSILTFGAMIGAITSGPIADLVGRKWVRQGESMFNALISERS